MPLQNYCRHQCQHYLQHLSDGSAYAYKTAYAGGIRCSGGVDELKTVISYGSDNTHPTYNNVLPVSSTTKRGDGSLALTTIYTYDVYGNVTSSIVSGKGDGNYYFYDAVNRQIGVIGIDPDGSGSRPRPAKRTYYDTDGRVYKVDTGTATGIDLTALNNMVVLQRDSNDFDPATGLATVARHYDNGTQTHVTQKSYTNMFQTDCVAVRLNAAAFGSLPSSACNLGTAGADGNDRITKYTYDATGAIKTSNSAYATAPSRLDFSKIYNTNGTLAYVTDGNGNRTTYYYDLFNRLIKTCFPIAGSGATSSTTDCEQTVYSSSFYNNARVYYNSLRDGSNIYLGYDADGRISAKSGALSETYGYNNFDMVLTHTNNSQTETYTYNSVGQLLSDAQAMGTVTYTYDGFYRRNKLIYPGSGLYVTYGYDAGDELTSILENGTTSVVSFDYDNYGRRSHLYRGNSQTTTYGYDTSSNLTSIAQTSNTLSFTYNTADQIKTKTNSNTSFAFTPAAKNLTYGVDGLNRISTIGGSSFVYDGRGNLNSDGGGTYVYNVNNLLTSATQSSVASTLAYDAENRLLSIAKNGTTTKFLYDGDDIIAEYNGSNVLLRRYVHGAGEDEPLVWYEGAGTGSKSWFMSDDKGSVISLTNSSGTTSNVNTYDEYGLPGSGNSGRFQYTGQVWLPEIGMYYYKARLYSPAVGRFMQTDPVGYADGMNWYAYVHDDPIDGTDSSGLAGSSNGADTYNAPAPEVTVTATGCFMKNGCYTEDNWRKYGPGAHPDAGEVNDTIAPWELIGPGDVEGVFMGLKFVVTEGLENAPKIGALAFKAVKGAGKACGCFVEGTEVATPVGLKPIEDIKVGDTVIAYDERTGELKAETVLYQRH